MPAQSRKDQLKEESGSYVPKLVACFYAVFDPTLGPRVVHQIPEGSVATALSTFPSRADSTANLRPSPHSSSTASSASLQPQTSSSSSSHLDPGHHAVPTEPIIRSTPVLFDFSSVIDFVIPKPELCGHLITKATRTSKILGLPTRIVDEEKYHHSKQVYNRNSFIFNLCFVFERDAELSVYEPVAWKVGRILGQMEETHSLLSNPPAEFSMANLLEQMYLDLNAYSETSISLLDTDLSLFLLPFYANPPDVKVWDVPIAVADLESMKSYRWDVTLYKICSFINGVNHVRKIAELAEVDLYLARMCIRHLVYYNAVILVDLFQFTNSYTALPDIAEIAHAPEDDEDEGTDVRTECENYVFSGGPDVQPVPFPTLLKFYSQLRPGLTVSAWIDDFSLDSHPIDVRRMIQFGIIKGFLRRVYAYPIWIDHPSLCPAPAPDTSNSKPATAEEGSNERKKMTTTALRRLEIDGGGGGGRETSTTATGDLSRARRPSLSRAQSSQPKMLHSPFSETSTRSAPEPSNDNKVPLALSLSHARPSQRDAPAAPLRNGRPSGRDEDDDPSRATTAAAAAAANPAPVYPTSLTMMLDGNQHTDEICLKYGIGWRTLQVVLKHLGGGGNQGTATGAGGGRGGNDDDVEDGYSRRQTRDSASARRPSRETTGFDKSGYGSNVVMLWI
ncbi:hypothetical protein JCM11491_004926 [Sporobolomyces phaffii]